MRALLSYQNLHLLSIMIGVMTAILIFAIAQDTANATVPIPSQTFELAGGHENPEGIWSDGTIVWLLLDGEDELVAYNLATTNKETDRDIELASSNSSPQGIWSDGSTMWVADWDDTKLYAYRLSDGARRENRDINLTGPNDAPRGLWGLSNTIFVVDKDDSYVYAYQKNGTGRQQNREFDLHNDNDNAWGIWGEGSTAYVNDLDDKLLYRYSLTSGDSTQVREMRLPLGNDKPTGIWADDEVMWVADRDDNHLYAMYYQGFRSSGDDVDVTDVNLPTGLWTDGDTMWVADAGLSGAGKLYAYNIGSGMRDVGKDVQLESGNDNPVAMWSDGTTIWVAEDETSGNGFLYAYALDQDPNATQLLQPYQSITLDTDNSEPSGTWSDGETIWVSDSGDDKLYAYDLDQRNRVADKDLELDAENSDPAGIWSDGKFIWVMDTADFNAYVYGLNTGDRKEKLEFRPAPANEHLSGGIAGHEARLWVVDAEDEKLFAYRKATTPPTFSRSSARFEIHHSLAGDSYIGTAPAATDRDGDSLTYSLSGLEAGRFTVNSETLEIRTAAGTTDFFGGDNYRPTLSVTDGKRGLTTADDTVDDAINITIFVKYNADPEILTPALTNFTAREDVDEDDVLAELDIVDLDGDSLYSELNTTPNNPFRMVDNQVKLKTGHSLDYESVRSYLIELAVRDNKDESGQTDSSWDSMLRFRINVTNVDELAELILSSAQPEVGTAVVATLTDPDIVNLDDGNQVNWVVVKSLTSDSNVWINVSNSHSTSTSFEYTPVEADAGYYLRITANYWDKQSAVTGRTRSTVSENPVLAEAATNSSPVFAEGTTTTRTIAENSTGGINVGAPVTATDDDEDTLVYRLSYHSSVPAGYVLDFDSSTGQMSLADNTLLDYETKDSYRVSVSVGDQKDADGNADLESDAFILVTIRVTNVEEPGIVELSSDGPLVGEELTASLTDPDGSVTNLTWQWQAADSAESATWTDIAGATLATFTPAVSDIGKYLRAQASYDDEEGTGKQAAGTSASAVTRTANAPPTFDEGASTTRSLSENSPSGTRVGAVVAATDPDDDTLTYSLASGTVSGHFSIDPASGRLEVSPGAVLDYETDATLEVELQVSDDKAVDHSQSDTVDATITLAINLVNVDEPGSVSLSSSEPEVGTSVTATLTDPDVVNSSDWRWEKSQDGVNGWTTIPGASTEAYTPASGDVDMYLRAMVDYTDGEGSGKSADGMTADTVKEVVETSLASLTLNGIPFTFSSSTIEYSLSVPNSKKRTKVIATPTASSGVSVDITPADSKPNKNGHQMGLAVGANQISIVVSEDPGSASTTYTVQVTREEPPTPDPPQQDPPPQDQPSDGSVAGVCRNDERDGLIANCIVGRFAVVRVELDGGYTIDWSEWDSSHPDVTGYSIVLSELLYKTYYDENGQVRDAALADVYESCEFITDEWNCEGRLTSNHFEDWDGNATQARELAANEDRTEWSSSLEAPGRLMFDKNFVRWSGNSTDPNNEPTDVAYRVGVFEMDMYYFTMHEGSQRSDREIALVDGANGFDERQG